MAETMTCYRHPDRETGVSCSECGRGICPDCMRFAPVGIRCPDHAGTQKVVRGIPRQSPTQLLTRGGGDSTHHTGSEVDEIWRAVDDNRRGWA